MSGDFDVVTGPPATPRREPEPPRSPAPPSAPPRPAAPSRRADRAGPP
jgi:hypothetical protein